MPPDVLPPQGDSTLCWAASLVCAARYHGYPSVRGIRRSEDVEAVVWRERRSLAIPSAWGQSRDDVCSWRAGRERILLLAAALGVNCEGTTRPEIPGHLALGHPVIARWTPRMVEAADPIAGGHFGVICSWTPARVRITDSLFSRPGEAPGTRSRTRPAIPTALFEPAMGTRSLIAVLPP